MNVAPTINSFSKIGTQDQIIDFFTIDFSNNFIDNGKHDLKKIKIINLPEYGILKLFDNPIYVNQEI